MSWRRIATCALAAMALLRLPAEAQPAVSISYRFVVQRQDGTPLAESDVNIRARMQVGGAQEPEIAYDDRTDARGGFLLEMQSVTQYLLYVSAPGAGAVVYGPAAVPEGAAPPVVLRLQPARNVRVKVIESKSKAPVADASVRFAYSGSLGGIAPRAQTDAAGSCLFACVTMGKHNIGIQKYGYNQKRLSIVVEPGAGDQEVAAPFARFTSVTGVIFKDKPGAPASAAQINLLPLGIGATANGEGRFTINGVAPDYSGPADVTLEGYPRTWTYVRLAEEKPAPELTIILKPAGAIAGLLFDMDAVKPIAGAMVMAVPVAGCDRAPAYFKVYRPGEDVNPDRTPRCTAQTNREGRFQIGNLPEGAYILLAPMADGVNPLLESVAVRAGETTEGADLALGVQPADSTALRMLDKEGKALTNAPWTLEWSGPRGPGSTTGNSASDAGVFFKCDKALFAQDGTYRLTLTAQGRAPAVRELRVIGGIRPKQLDFLLEPAGGSLGR